MTSDLSVRPFLVHLPCSALPPSAALTPQVISSNLEAMPTSSDPKIVLQNLQLQFMNTLFANVADPHTPVLTNSSSITTTQNALLRSLALMLKDASAAFVEEPQTPVIPDPQSLPSAPRSNVTSNENPLPKVVDCKPILNEDNNLKTVIAQLESRSVAALINLHLPTESHTFKKLLDVIPHFSGALAPAAESVALVFMSAINPAIAEGIDIAPLRNMLWSVISSKIRATIEQQPDVAPKILQALVEETSTPPSPTTIGRFIHERLSRELTEAKPDLALSLLLLKEYPALAQQRHIPRKESSAADSLIDNALKTLLALRVEDSDELEHLLPKRASHVKSALLRHLNRELQTSSNNINQHENIAKEAALLEVLKTISEPEQLRQMLDQKLVRNEGGSFLPNIFLPHPSLIKYCGTDAEQQLDDEEDSNKKSLSQSERIELSLSLPGMGDVTLALTLTGCGDEHASVEISVDDSIVASLMKTHSPLLKEAFAKEGFADSNVSIFARPKLRAVRALPRSGRSIVVA